MTITIEKFDVWVYLKTKTGFKAQYFGICEGDPGCIVDSLKVLFAPDMIGADIIPLNHGEMEEDTDD